MKKLNIFTLFLTCFMSSTTIWAMGPPGSTINSLFLKAGNGSSTTTIYANGVMQAKINIFYDIDESDSLKKIELKELYTGSILSNFNISDIKDERFDSDVLVSKSRTTRSVSSSFAYKSKYLSTKFNSVSSICAELTTVNGSFQSTCQGDTNDSYVQLTSLMDIEPSFKDWVLTSFLISPSSLGSDSLVYAYSPPNGRKIAYVSYGEIYYNPRIPRNARLIHSFSHDFVNRISEAQSYVIVPNSGLTPNTFPYFNKKTNKWETFTFPHTTTTNNRLVFIENISFNNNDRIISPISDSSLGRRVDFLTRSRQMHVYDNYGTKTTIHFRKLGHIDVSRI